MAAHSVFWSSSGVTWNMALEIHTHILNSCGQFQKEL